MADFEKVHCEFTKAYLGVAWRRGVRYWGEERWTQKRSFATPEERDAWLRERARATLGPAWAATVDARALGDAA